MACDRCLPRFAVFVPHTVRYCLPISCKRGLYVPQPIRGVITAGSGLICTRTDS